MSKVLVLMSTFNGERYIREQLDSLLENASEDIQLDLMVRDDGSSDNTVNILNEYRDVLHIKCIRGENIGVAQSFRKLIETCPMGYDAFAYADQDDIWEKDKISSALEVLKQHTGRTPTLWYCGVIHYLKGKLGKKSICSYEKATCFEAVIDTFSTTNGCTMVFNEELLHVLRSCDEGPIDMHDSFTHAMCLAAGGKICSDERPLVKYRIHENQVLGLGGHSIKKSVHRFLHPSRLRSSTLEVMLTSKFICQEKIQYLQMLCKYKNLRNKCYILWKRKPNCMTRKEFIKFKVQILMNSF